MVLRGRWDALAETCPMSREPGSPIEVMNQHDAKKLVPQRQSLEKSRRVG